MTSDIKKKIIALKKQGYGYKKISNELNVPISSVRYVCSTGVKEEGAVGTCLNCGAETVSVPHKKQKKFCSDRCRWDWWNEHNRQVKKHD